MKRLYRQSLGCFFLGVFITNGVIYMFSETPSVWGGVASMGSWILMWLFLVAPEKTPLSEAEKLFAGFSMGASVCYLFAHIFLSYSVPDYAVPVILLMAVWFFLGATVTGQWWSEVSPPD